jgi:hypothetical protein
MLGIDKMLIIFLEEIPQNLTSFMLNKSRTPM